MRFQLLAIFTSIFLTACGGGNSTSTKPAVAADNSGICSEAFLRDYNNVVRNYNTLSEHLRNRNEPTLDTRGLFVNFQSACKNFYANQGSTSCKALDEKTRTEIQVSGAKFQSKCDEADKYLANRIVLNESVQWQAIE